MSARSPHRPNLIKIRQQGGQGNHIDFPKLQVLSFLYSLQDIVYWYHQWIKYDQWGLTAWFRKQCTWGVEH